MERDKQILSPCRREFLRKCGGGLAGILAAGECPALVKGIIAASQTSRGFINKPETSDVEWIESDSNQYITTGFRIKSGYTLTGRIGYRPSGTSTRQIDVTGGYYYSGSFYKVSIFAKYGMTLGIRAGYPSINMADSPYWINNAPIGKVEMADFEIGPNGSFCNGECFTNTPFTINDSYPFYVGLFCYGNNTPHGKRWAFQYPAAIGRMAMFNESGDPVFDMVAYRFKNDDGVEEGALRDKVSGELFRNQGTGAFVIGPDKR